MEYGGRSPMTYLNARDALLTLKLTNSIVAYITTIVDVHNSRNLSISIGRAQH
jgi:hypothetical protein